MCGICGIASADISGIDEATITRMNDALQHRGPDGAGYLHRPGAGLAMRRLAIIDVAGGDQPIANEDESLWIMYNGEGYNYPQLRAELDVRGHQFRTNTDTECLLHLYEDYGDDCVTHFRGMFAFALWDDRQQRLLIARDRLGQKPVYYTVQAGYLYWGSEMNALLQVLPQKPTLNLQAIDSYLSLQYIPEPNTPFEGIYKLPPAHRLIWQGGELRIEPYWEMEYGPKHTQRLPDLIAELRERMRAAVEMRMISEVPLGAHLSGGIDSSVIVALMARASNQPVKTFSVGFEESSFSELGYAKAVADQYQTDHHEFILHFDDIPHTLSAITRHVGEPFADPSALPLYHLSRLTREHVTVALNGDGGDEAFGGYQRYWLDPYANAYLTLPDFIINQLLPKFANMLSDRADKPIGGSLVNGLKRLEQLTMIDPRASILRWGSYFSPQRKAKLWRKERVAKLNLSAAEEILVSQFDGALAESFLDRTLATDILTYLPGNLLVKADRMTMAHSLEGRSPFLDHELMNWTAKLPERYKLRGRTGKWILREAFKDMLPPEIMRRGKQGFGIPVGAWFRGALQGLARERILDAGSILGEWFEREALETILDEHASGHVDHGKRIYALVMLAEWAAMYL